MSTNIHKNNKRRDGINILKNVKEDGMNTLNKPESSQLAEILAAESDLEMNIDIISL